MREPFRYSVLHVGGPFDGQRRNVPAWSYVAYSTPSVQIDEAVEVEPLRTCRYELRKYVTSYAAAAIHRFEREASLGYPPPPAGLTIDVAVAEWLSLEDAAEMTARHLGSAAR